MKYEGRIGAISEIRRTRAELCLEWSIPDFLSLSSEGDSFYDTRCFSFCNCCWYLKIFPNMRSSGRVTLSVCRDDLGTSATTITFMVGVKGSEGVEKRREGEKEFYSHNDFWYLWNFCSISELRKLKQRLLPEDSLTITFEMKVPCSTIGASPCPDLSIPAYTQARQSNACACKCQSLDKQGTEKLVEDVGKMLACWDKRDVTVRVGGVEFQMHSFILFARCPALSISLRHKCAEEASNTIVVEDCEPDIFRDFVHFLYTGSVQSLTEVNAFGLYRIADRYLVDDLKWWCLELIQDTLSIRTFCDAVRLALVHRENGLMERAIAFATQNISLIVCSEEWQNFRSECPSDVMIEILINLGLHPYPLKQIL